jgi:ketosteroid isomerase-like protein
MKKQCLVLLMLLPAWSLGFANDSPQALQDAFMTAMRANDVDGLAACYTADATNFPLGSMSGIGPESVRASWGGFLGAFRIIDANLSDDQLIVLGDTAVAWGLFNITAVPVDGGEPVEMQGRYTDVAKNIDGTWLYIMDHASVPSP